MDSAKKQKSSLEENSEFAAFGALKPGKFNLSSSFWESLDRDPLLKAEFDRRVSERAHAILQDEAAPQRKALLESSRQEGLQQGLAEGKQKVAELCQSLDAISASLIREKETILHEHEKIWCEAIRHLMQRFMVPLSVERLKALEDWMQEAIGELSQQSKVRVAVPSSVFKQATELLPAQKWEWVEDETLKGTELRVEIKGGGVFFSPEKEWEKFEAKLDEVFGVNSP